MAVAQILASRGIESLEEAREFLRPSISQLHDPFLFDGMEDVIDCLYGAKSIEETICIYGDYDVDGVCASSILVDYLKKQDFSVFHYIPSRHDEGYGLNCAAIDKIVELGASVLLTVDCGITALNEIEYAQKCGMDVIITDHHHPLDELPDCAAIVNPHTSPNYPFTKLCGAGIALKVVQALGGIDHAQEYLDVAAIATVADIVPLLGENRAIVALGLERIRAGKTRVGISALLQESGIDQRDMRSEHIAYGIAPRINAAGRLGSAQAGVDLFLCDEIEQAQRLAKKLNQINLQRKEIEAEIFSQALEQIENGAVDLLHDPAIVLHDSRWNAGLIGIVASKLMERYYKPVLLFAGAEEIITASCRSILGIHLFETLHHFAHLFERYGGHAMAAGLAMKKEHFVEFKEQVNDFLRENIDFSVFLPICEYDFRVSPNQLTLSLAEQLLALEPYGEGNGQPAFLLKDVKVNSMKTMGQGFSHLRMKADELPCVAFSMGHRVAEFSNNLLNMTGSLNINTWNNSKAAQFLVQNCEVAFDKNTEECVIKSEWKLFNALYQQIEYNSNVTRERSKPITLAEAFSHAMDYPSKTAQGLLLVANTPESAKVLLAFLESNLLQECFGINWLTMQNPCGYHSVLLGLQPRTKDQFQFDKAIVFDNCFTDALEDILLLHGVQEIQFVQRNDENMLISLCISREVLGKIYQAIRMISMQKQTFVDAPDYFAFFENVIPKDLRFKRQEILFALHVFSQLNLIEWDENARFYVTAIESPLKKELYQSNLFVKTQEFAQRFLDQ